MRSEHDPRLSDRSGGHLVRDLLLGAGAFGLYLLVASLDAGRMAAAHAHALDLLRLEQWLRLDVEAPANRWLARQSVVETLANYEYAITYVVSAFGLLFWLYARRRDQYRLARNSFLLLNVIAIGCFALYPVMPPRMLGRGYADTVQSGRLAFSWGSSAVSYANTVAAMPSLHLAWAVWVSAVLAALSQRRGIQAISAAHVALTLAVIIATANHFVLDAIAGVALAIGSVALAHRGERFRDARWVTSGRPVPSADAFFLHVEDGAGSPAPQHVGGVVLLDASALPGGRLTRAALEEVVRCAIEDLPRFRQRLTRPGGARTRRWRRWRWVPAERIDWAWHVQDVDLSRDGATGEPSSEGASCGQDAGLSAFEQLVGRLAREALPRDRPLWRLFAVNGIGSGRVGVVLIVHHVVADGIGTVAQALHLLEPAPGSAPWGGLEATRPLPSAARRAAAIAAGIGQLATDGFVHGRLPSSPDGQRGYAMARLDLGSVRAAARAHGVRVSDVLLAGIAAGLASCQPLTAGAGRRGRSRGRQIRVAIPLMVRAPDDAAEGNVTAAVMLDLPLNSPLDSSLDSAAGLELIASRSRTLYSGTRALASRFVMQVAGVLLPPPAHAWFARAVYGRRFFQAIVSNMPGPDVPLTMAGAPLIAAFPLLPLAPGAPLAAGTLGWNGSLCLGLAYDPALIDQPRAFVDAVVRRIEQLARLESPQSVPPEEESRATAPSAASPEEMVDSMQ